MSEEQALVPSLRFPEFRDSGEWVVKKLGDKDISSFVKKRVSVNNLELDSYVSTENILPDFGGIKGASKLPPSGSFTSYKPEDILIANIRPYLKKIWVADRNGAASNDVVVVRPMKGIIGSFLSSLLRSDSFIDYVMKGAKGVKMPRGDVSLMKEYSLAVPCPKEQKKIADCLSLLGALISAQAEKLDALKTHKKGLMQQLFPREGEINPRLRFLRKETWDIANLSEVTFFQEGPGIMAVDFRDEGVPLVRLAGVSGEVVTLDGCNYLDPEKVAQKWSHFRLKINDLVISTSATFGLIAIVTNETADAVFYTGLIRFRPRCDMLYLGYLKAFLGSPCFKRQAAAAAVGGGIKHFGPTHLKQMDIPLPSVAEQQKMAGCLSSLDTLIAAHTEKLDALKAHKKGLMQQLFPSPEAVSA
ncbi:restriction endonuclease subunit S [Vreelandella salicampi]|uniref:Restriction endonuclease subunit S n=1 Tax=Vreelandella salicampi TaxID=1449798 RepID=A0A7Z0LMN4_9GAMM|nr:restriction endonuclease subunit S [Halomonas salicampi]NYS61796.1 restriction endonuclease subunit S [Halomonas salicampi]